MHYKHKINTQFKHLEEDLLNIKSLFQKNTTSIHKARNELKILKLSDGNEYVVKSFKVPHLLNRVVYAYFRDSKAKKSYENGLKLMQLEVNTPTPVGVIEFFENGLLHESYFISQYQKYDFTIREVFHHKVENYKDGLKAFSAFTYEIHQKGVWHVDYSLGNILVTQKDNEFHFSLVDINRMKFQTIPPELGLKNFNKFWAKDENDLILIAQEYAKLTHFDEEKAKQIVLSEAKKLEAQVNLKKRLK